MLKDGEQIFIDLTGKFLFEPKNAVAKEGAVIRIDSIIQAYERAKERGASTIKLSGKDLVEIFDKLNDIIMNVAPLSVHYYDIFVKPDGVATIRVVYTASEGGEVVEKTAWEKTFKVTNPPDRELYYTDDMVSAIENLAIPFYSLFYDNKTNHTLYKCDIPKDLLRNAEIELFMPWKYHRSDPNVPLYMKTRIGNTTIYSLVGLANLETL